MWKQVLMGVRFDLRVPGQDLKRRICTPGSKPRELDGNQARAIGGRARTLRTEPEVPLKE